MRALYRFHLYYTIRRNLWHVGVALPSSKIFGPFKTDLDISLFKKIKKEFGIPAEMGLSSWSWRCDQRRLFEDGKTSELFKINIAAGHIPQYAYRLTDAGFRAISKRISAYTICILSAQSATHATIVCSTASALESQKEFSNALEAYIMRPRNFDADITHYENTFGADITHYKNIRAAPAASTM